jgi:hypothetical protein
MSTVFNVDRFKAELTNGGARPNQFAVQLTFPNYVASRGDAVRKAPFLVTAAELPGQSIGVEGGWTSALGVGELDLELAKKYNLNIVTGLPLD